MRLYINIDHVATLREARRTDEPDPVAAARLAEDAGADGITAHLREDRRHIQDRDVERLASSVRTVLNLELATSGPIVDLACRLRPFQATIVPERREEVTTEGGLDLAAGGDRLAETIRRLAVHAGHGLTYQNVGPVAGIAEIEELNIGHSIVSRSVTTGIAAAVAEMRRLVDRR